MAIVLFCLPFDIYYTLMSVEWGALFIVYMIYLSVCLFIYLFTLFFPHFVSCSTSVLVTVRFSGFA